MRSTKALSACARTARGALWCVFGCGGDRDAGKRPLMGAIADELADRRHRHRRQSALARTRRAIVATILAAAITANAPHVVEHDRGAAIRLALARAGAGDVVLIAGKGHEDYQIYGGERRAFSDQTRGARSAARRLAA